MVRGRVVLPHGTGKIARVIVFATGAAAEAAIAAGADEVGGDELTREGRRWLHLVRLGRLDPRLMGKVGGRQGTRPARSHAEPEDRHGGPDVAKAVTDIKGGKIEFRVDKHSNVHFVVGQGQFHARPAVRQRRAAIDEVVRPKPSTSKGRYITKGTVSTTFGPGIPVDVNALA